jgi:hypothetical protein
LDSQIRTNAERRFGHDFGRVRVHTDTSANDSARSIGAVAYTRGSDIYFAPGRFAPSSPDGERLLFHELTHVVQQERSASRPVSALASDTAAHDEREALDLSERAIAGERVTPLARPHSLVQRQSDAGVPAAPPAPTWEQQVNAAKAETDATKRSAALGQLVQQALGTGTTVHTVPVGATLDPSQMKPTPAVNFDLNLNQKQSWPHTKGAATRPLKINVGYSFSKGSDTYVVLGPNAVDPRSPLYTEMSMRHEFFHVAHHLGAGAAKQQTTGGQKPSDDDQELEAWTNDFTNYFEKLFPFRQQWAPLIEYYERASAGPRKTSLDAIVAFHKASDPKIQAALDRWLKRRQADASHTGKALVKDLASALAPKSAPAPPPSP